MFDSFKDLRRGDLVSYKNVDTGTEIVSGHGQVYGFGSFGVTDFVWIDTGDGKLIEAPYDAVKKI